MLSVRDLTVHYDGVAALTDVAINVDRGEIVAVIGANGAGKSTFLRTIVGLVGTSGGSITFNNESIAGIPTDAIVRRGISLVPETRELFPLMNCKDNLRAGLILHKGSVRFEERAEPIFQLFPRLKERLHQRAGTLSGGEQQMLAIGRALMQDPNLLLLDEPSLGLSPNLTDQLFERIGEIRTSGRTVLLVEQKARLALEIADRAYLLTVGRITADGPCEKLREEETVKRLYFGEREESE